MKGIILAGGSGTRLYPLTTVTSKQLLPVYDKPMVYYPLSVLMMAGIRDILLISTPKDLPNFERLLGGWLPVRGAVVVQGAAEPGWLGAGVPAGRGVHRGGIRAPWCWGDNIFYGNGLGRVLRGAVRDAEAGRASVFGYYVDDPERYGVVDFDETGKAVSIEEKPVHPRSNYAVTGLYFYDRRVVEYAKRVRPSARGELEITDLNRMYLEDGSLRVRTLGRGYAWLDTGTMDSLFEAGEFVRTVQRAQGLPIAVVEEIAYQNGWISREELLESARRYGKSPYGKHLQGIADGEIRLIDNSKTQD
ncbi:glucose-1-phosphate thymidylyltransferase [Bifidobacterium thermophilum]|nr:glucose-1-phosphate thymidylyltransferase [Bifidobacterium thermophilum]